MELNGRSWRILFRYTMHLAHLSRARRIHLVSLDKVLKVQDRVRARPLRYAWSFSGVGCGQQNFTSDPTNTANLAVLNLERPCEIRHGPFPF